MLKETPGQKLSDIVEKVLESILSVPLYQPWDILKETLIWEYSEFKSPAHACAHLDNMHQGDDELLRIYIH